MNSPADIVVIDVTSKKKKKKKSIIPIAWFNSYQNDCPFFADIINTVTNEGSVTNEKF